MPLKTVDVPVSGAPKPSGIIRLGYNDDDSTLEVSFQSGSTYQYADVPIEVFEGFVNAPSKGKYFHANVRDSYQYTRI